jgi:hypothetical protein
MIVNMQEPELTVLGVYRPQISAETWQEQWQVTGSDEQTREHFAGLTLIEAVVKHLVEPFNISRLGEEGAVESQGLELPISRHELR